MLTGQEQYHWERAGYFIRRAVLTPSEVETGLAATERVLQKRRGDYSHLIWTGDKPTPIFLIEHLFHPSLYEQPLLDVLGKETVLGAIEGALGPEVRYHDASLLVELERAADASPWQREHASDVSAQAGTQMTELARTQHNVQCNLALLEDECLWVVPGTHLEPLSAEQSQTLASNPSGDQTGQVCIRLQPGDALFYNANLLHREKPDANRPRRTLHYAFFAAQPKQPVVPEPWLAEPSFLETLSPAVRPLFNRYVAAMRPG